MPFAFQKQISPHSRIALWKIEENIEAFQQLLGIKHHGSQEDKSNRNLHWLSSRALLKYLLPDFSPEQLVKDEFGKPFLPGNLPHLSISHAHEYAAIMLCEKGACGIDIEHVNNRIGRVAHKFIREDEQVFLQPGYTTEMMYLIWCAKESLYKLYGRKELDFRKNMLVFPFSYQEKGSFRAKIHKGEFNKEFEIHYEKYGEYLVAWVMDEIGVMSYEL